MVETVFSVMIKGIILIYTGLLFPLIQKYLETQVSQYQNKQKQQEERINEINIKYLSPLRLYLKESYIRLYKISQKIQEVDSHSSLISLNRALDFKNKSQSWMINEGYYLISSCYIIGCLFACIKKIRDNIAFIKIGKNQDAILLQYMDQINLAFAHSKGGGVNFIIQLSIAQDIWLKEEQRLMTYREFCEMLLNDKIQEWWYSLIDFFIEAGKKNEVKIKRLQLAIYAIENLSNFLDENIGQGDSIDIVKKFVVEDMIIRDDKDSET